jgi:prolipoprotein diacylglyceryltransferase
VPLASIPSPGPASWHLGPFSVRAYALCIVAGIVVAVMVTAGRYRRAGGRPGVILDVAAWAVPFGLAGAFAHAILIDTRHDFASVHRVPGYENYATFQPAFAYQSLWDTAVGFGVIVAARRLALTGERTFMLCAAGYAAGGYWVESVRIGPLPHALGLRYGALGDIVVFVLAVAGLYATRPRSRRPPPPRPHPKALQPAPITLVDDSPGDVMST